MAVVALPLKPFILENFVRIFLTGLMEPLLAIGAFCRDSTVQTVIQFHLVVVAASNITDTDPVNITSEQQ